MFTLSEFCSNFFNWVIYLLCINIFFPDYFVINVFTFVTFHISYQFSALLQTMSRSLLRAQFSNNIVHSGMGSIVSWFLTSLPFLFSHVETPTMSVKDKEEKTRRCEFIQGMLISTILDDDLWKETHQDVMLQWLANSQMQSAIYGLFTEVVYVCIPSGIIK